MTEGMNIAGTYTGTALGDVQSLGYHKFSSYPSQSGPQVISQYKMAQKGTQIKSET